MRACFTLFGDFGGRGVVISRTGHTGKFLCWCVCMSVASIIFPKFQMFACFRALKKKLHAFSLTSEKYLLET